MPDWALVLVAIPTIIGFPLWFARTPWLREARLTRSTPVRYAVSVLVGFWVVFPAAAIALELAFWGG